MQLIRPTEMHLARQSGMVSLATQVMRIGGRVRRQIRGIVVGANLGGQLAGDHDEARGSAERRVAVGRVKCNSLTGETVEVGGFDGGAFVVKGQEGRGHLVGHDVEDVWFFGHFSLYQTVDSR